MSRSDDQKNNNQDQILTIEELNEKHISAIEKLWKDQYRQQIQQVSSLPNYWQENTEYFTSFINGYITNENGIVILVNNELIGYLVYDNFDFHGEKTILVPIMGHVVIDKYKENGYQLMYQYFSEKWVKKGYLNHLISYFSTDTKMTKVLFELGFGLYVIDGYRSQENIKIKENNFTVIKANEEHIEDIMLLEKEIIEYFRKAPIFLVSKKDKSEDREKKVDEDRLAIFIIYENTTLIGYMQIEKLSGNDTYILADKGTSIINGAYIKPEYRKKGVGKILLNQCINWSKLEKCKQIHVDFESANVLGKAFWEKHFEKVIYSVKRRVNQDIF